MKMSLPVAGYTPLGALNRLAHRMMRGRRECRTFVLLFALVVPEPVLSRLEALDHGVSCARRVLARVLGRRRVAAADVSTVCAATEMKPPSVVRQAFDTTGATRRHGRIDRIRECHPPPRFVPRGSRSWARDVSSRVPRR